MSPPLYTPGMQAKDIPDIHVIELAGSWSAGFGRCVLDALVDEGVPIKVAMAKIDKLIRRGWLEYGTSPRCAWPTPEGEAAVSSRRT